MDSRTKRYDEAPDPSLLKIKYKYTYMNYTLINPDNLQKWIDIEIADCPAHIVAKRGI